MEESKDYYGVLEVSPTADDAAIKAAFRRLARRYHPDVARSGRGGHRFLDIQEAYAVLSDPEKRQEYDRVFRERQPSSLALSAVRRRRRRDAQRRGRSGRLGITLDLLGLRVGVAIDATRTRFRR